MTPSPYLIDRPPHNRHGAVTVTVDVEEAVVVLAVRGTWGRNLRRDTFLALEKCMSEHPRAVIVDARALGDPAAASVTTWLTVRHVGERLAPAVRTVLCASPDTPLVARLHRIGAPRFLPMFATVAQARDALRTGLPLTDRLRLELAPDSDAPEQACDLVTDACAAWGLTPLAHRARLVMAELVGNAVRHARTPIRVLVWRHGRGLHLVVGDGEPELPRPDGGAGRGLGIVHDNAGGWGAMPTAGGKMVWASIRPR